MANLTSTTITGTLDTTSTITGPGSGVSALNASNVSSGTLSNDRLDTVPVSKGGTGLTALGSANQVLQVNAGGTALEFATAAAGGGGLTGNYYTSPATWTKPADLVAVKVTVLGGGGGGARGSRNPGGNNYSYGGYGGGGGFSQEIIQASDIPGPVSVTVGSGGGGAPTNTNGNPGGTSSFGAFLSASGGSVGNNGSQGTPGNPGGNGNGSGGQFNASSFPTGGVFGGLGYRGLTPQLDYNASQSPGGAGAGRGGGGGGAADQNSIGGAGTAGLVIVENIF